MMPLDPVSLSFGAALLLGLSFGSGPCNIACLPYLGPVFLTNSEGVRGSWRTLLPFSLGRLTGYALLGTVAGAAGLFVPEWIAGPWVSLVAGRRHHPGGPLHSLAAVSWVCQLRTSTRQG